MEPKGNTPFKIARGKVETVGPVARLVFELLCWSMSEAVILCKMCWRRALQNEVLSKHHSRDGFRLCAWPSELSPSPPSAHPLCCWRLASGYIFKLYFFLFYFFTYWNKQALQRFCEKCFQVNPEFVIWNLIGERISGKQRIQMSSDLPGPRMWRNTAKWKSGARLELFGFSFPCICYSDHISGFQVV